MDASAILRTIGGMRATGPHPAPRPVLPGAGERGLVSRRALWLCAALAVAPGLVVLRVLAARGAAPQPDRAIYGSVVTDAGDPLPGAELRCGGGPAAICNRHGEFCLFLVPGPRRRVVACRTGFVERAYDVCGGAADVELLVRLRPRSEAAAAPMRRFFVTDVLSRGIPGVVLELFRSGASSPLCRATSCADGSVHWSGAREATALVDACARSPEGDEWTRRSVRLIDGDAMALPERAPEDAPLTVEFDGPATPGDGSLVALLDVTGRRILEGTVAGGRLECIAPDGAPAWAAWNDGVVAGVRRIELLGGRARLSRGTAAQGLAATQPLRCVEIPVTPGVAETQPVLVPYLGELRVVYGPAMSDAVSSSALFVPDIPLTRLAGAFRSPALDLDPSSLSLRPGAAGSDVRLLADFVRPGAGEPGVPLVPRRVIARRGSASVTVRLTDSPQTDAAREPAPRSDEFLATLARRGGPYACRRRMRTGEDATWPSLCGGSFLLTVERLGCGASATAGGARLQVFEDIRRVLVPPGTAVLVDVRIDPVPNAPALTESHR